MGEIPIGTRKCTKKEDTLRKLEKPRLLSRLTPSPPYSPLLLSLYFQLYGILVHIVADMENWPKSISDHFHFKKIFYNKHDPVDALHVGETCFCAA